jgi:hypothetical protein
MRRRPRALWLAALLFMLFSMTVTSALNSAAAAAVSDEDTDTRIAQARVVEVAETRISVMARTNVEHVVAVDREGTKVTIDGKAVSLKDVREGDIVTIELDAQKPVKFARSIQMRASQSQVARFRR